VHEVATAEALDATVAQITSALLAASPDAGATCKRLVRDVAGQEISLDLVAITVNAIADSRTSAHGREGVQSFLQKRKPTWST